MTTKTKIANAAMALLGQGRFVDVDTDTTEQAKWVRDIYDNSLDEALRAHPWNWASGMAVLGENLLLFSEKFDNAAWTKTNATATANQLLAPNGELTADLLNDADAGNAGTVVQAVTVANNADSHVFSVFLRQGTAAVTRILLAYSGGTGSSQAVDITWGTTPTVDAGTIEDVGGGWWRVTVVLVNNSSGNVTLTATIYPAGATAASTGTVYAWGAQIAQSTAQIGYAVTTDTASQPIFPQFGFRFGWSLPSDFQRLWDYNEGNLDYKIQGGFLLVNDSNPAINYAKQVTDPTEFDALFSRALSVQLAKDLCIVLTGSDSRMERLEKAWNKAIGQARTTDSQEDGEDKRVLNPWTAARFGGRSVTGGSPIRTRGF